MHRRSFLEATLAAATALRVAARPAKALKIGVTDWNLQQTGKVSAVALAAKLGFDGAQISLGRTPANGKLPLDDAGIQAQYVAAAKEHGIAGHAVVKDADGQAAGPVIIAAEIESEIGKL